MLSTWAQWFSELSCWSRSNNLNIKSIDNLQFNFLVLSTSLNHWLAGSHVLTLLIHLQLLVTTMLLASTSKQTLEVEPLLLTLYERCIFESDIISHVDSGPEHVVPSFTCFPSPSPCKQNFVPLSKSIFWGVYSQPSELEQGPIFNGSCNDLLNTQRPLNGWKITLYGSDSNKPGPACEKRLYESTQTHILKKMKGV